MPKPSESSTLPWLGDALWRCGETIRFAECVLAPILDILFRLWLAQIFFVSGVLKIGNWENALYLATREYPVPWLDPVTAAWLGAGTELIGSVLLAFGLGTRLAVVPMLALTIVAHVEYQALDQDLFWAAMFAWVLVHGAGPFSLDHAFRRGLSDSALPFAAAGVRAGQWSRNHLGPPFRLALRLWIAAALGAAGGMQFGVIGSDLLAAILPVRTAAELPGLLLIPSAMLLAAGLATRPVSVALFAALAATRMMDGHLGTDGYWLLVLALLAVNGGGRLSLDALVTRRLRLRFPQIDGRPGFDLAGLPRVVIVGAGFGGLACARALRRQRVQVTLIDRHNYHLFQPLLYQVATASLSPGDIAVPIRNLFRDQFNARVVYGNVTGVDTVGRTVTLGERQIGYDYLVLATGASHSYFGREDWGPFAPGLKRVEDATEVRRRVLTAFERAEGSDDDDDRRAQLTFLIVGGGPTGVELAGAIAELAHHGLEREFRNIDPASARVLLVQAGSRVLPTFPPGLSTEAASALERLGVEVLLDSRVEQIDGDGVTVSGRRIPARTVLWAAGVVASPAARWLDAVADNAGRVKVGADLSVPGLEGVFAIGDTALATAWRGQAVPGLAPAAKQGGDHVGKVIARRLAGDTTIDPFVYRHRGSLATIGRKAAVADFGRVRLSGAWAWWLWGVVHVGFLAGTRNRISVMLDWFWSYLTFTSGTRLITGAPTPPVRTEAESTKPIAGRP